MTDLTFLMNFNTGSEMKTHLINLKDEKHVEAEDELKFSNMENFGRT